MTGPEHRDPTPGWRSRWFLVAISGISLIALAIRVHLLSSRNLCYWDEGIFLMGVRFFRWRMHALASIVLSGADPGTVFFSTAYPGFPVFLQKPFHVVLLTVSSLLLGISSQTGTLHAAIYGTAVVGLTGVLAARIASPATGILTALLLCFEPYHVHYSRVGLHETDSMLLLVCAVLLWVRSDQRDSNRAACGAALFLVLSMGTSYRLFINMLLIGIFELLRVVTQKSTFSRIRNRLASMFLGAAAGVTFLELLHFSTFFPDLEWSEPASYIALLSRKFLSPESSMDLDFPFFYLDMFRQFDGLIPTACVCFAALVALISGTPAIRRIVVLFAIPFALYSVTTTRLARTVTGILPWAAILTADCLVRGSARRAGESLFMTAVRRGAMAVCTISILISYLLHLPVVYTVNSAYPEVIAFLDQTGTRRHLSTMLPISAFYAGKESVASPGATEAALRRQVEQEGYRYLVVDWQQYVRPLPSVMTIQTRVLPVFAVRNPMVDFFATLHENYLPADVPNLRQSDPSIGYIKVYDLWSIPGDAGDE